MFKSILPSSKRMSNSNFDMVTQLSEDNSGKENKPAQSAPASKGAGKNSRQASLAIPREDVFGEVQGTERAFDKLLDDLQIPSTLRPKLATMDSSVKAAMLKSSHIITSSQPTTPPRTPRSTLRRTHSIDSMSTPRAGSNAAEEELLPPPPIFSAMNIGNGLPSGGSGSPRRPSSHTRGTSFDLPRVFSRSQVNLSTATLNDSAPGSSGSTKDKKGGFERAITPTKFVSILSAASSTQIDVDSVKKLRLMLRNEPASWTQEFLQQGGYTALLTRLNELLEIEWREEQHDDKALHELLRCVIALSTSSVGCSALRSSATTPFLQLVSLLYSDKKPGEVATRQLIVDLLLVIFQIYPSSALPSSGSGALSRRKEVWDVDTYNPALVTLPSPHKSVFSLVRDILLTPAPLPAEATAAPLSPHEFIESLHKPRIYKTYLQELSDVCRDYFWVFCHPNNTIWVLGDVDESKVEKPRAPGGMTGGVEFEAMNYFTAHLRFLNATAKAAADLGLPAENELSAHRFHSDLFSSGLERVLLIARKASTTYYPTLHLEISRYLAHSAQARYELPWTVSRLVGSPPNNVLKTVRSSNPGSPVRRTASDRDMLEQTSPTKQGKRVSQGPPPRG